MKVILLAGGKSTRFSPLSDKMFFEFNGVSLLRHQVRLLKSCGLSDILLVVRETHKNQLQEWFGSELTLIVQEENTGMKGALMACESLLGSSPFILVSSNDVVEKTAFDLIEQQAKSPHCDGLLLCKKVHSYFPGGYLKLRSQNVIENIIEKPGAGKEPSDLINLVIHYHKDTLSLFRHLKEVKSDNDDLYEKALDMLFSEKTYKALPYDGFWQAVKYPWHLLDLMHFFLGGLTSDSIDSNVKIADTAKIYGPVVISSGVRIFDYAVIRGPCYIGKNSVIANHSLVRDSMIGENSVIGYSTEIARSYLRNNIWTHSNYLGDSIIDSNVSFGAGAITGNLRLDEQNICVPIQGKMVDTERNKLGAIVGSGARLGIHSNIMPGVRVGRNSFVASGVSLCKDLDDDSFIKNTQTVELRKNTFRAGVSHRSMENFGK